MVRPRADQSRACQHVPVPPRGVHMSGVRLASEWLARTSSGHCGVTEEGAEGVCDFGDSGSFGSQLGVALHSGNWSMAAAACLRRCARCSRCRHVSLSLRYADCSWYASCSSGLTRFDDFVSGAAPGSAALPKERLPSWELAWNASCAAPPRVDSPLCDLWSGGRCSERRYPSAPGACAHAYA